MLLRRYFMRVAAFTSVYGPQPSQRQSIKLFTPNRYSRSSRTQNSLFLKAGVLGMLGLGTQNTVEDVEDNEAKLVHNIKLGVLAFRKGEFDKAETLLHIALRMAQDMGNQDGATYIFDELANIALARGDFMKAEKLFRDVISRLLSQGRAEPHDNKIVAISLKLAKIYEDRNQDDKAVEGFRFCIKTQEDKIKNGALDEDTMALWGMSKDHYAQFLLSRKKNREAYSQFQDALRIARDVFGEEHSQFIVLLNSLGTVAAVMGDDLKALYYYEKAVKLAKAIQCENLSSYLINFGMAQIKKGLKKEALKSCKEGLKLGKKDQNQEIIDEANECIKMTNNL